MFAQVLAALASASLAVADNGNNIFVLTMSHTLVRARMDPIINPGAIGGHVHTVVGASNFRSQLNTPEEQQRAACTTVPIQADKSNYWAPTIFYMNEDGTMESMPANNRVYYFTEADNVPFPQGMRVVAGLSGRREFYATESQSIQIDCDEGVRSMFLPNATSHPTCSSVHAAISFPSCGWANQSLDSWDHFSHLAWPIQSGGGNVWDTPYGTECPPSHPIKYPRIFFQTNYYPTVAQRAQWGKRQDGINFVLANGDTTGLAFHADFVAGWDEQVLADTIKNCRNTNENLASCAPLAKSLDAEKAKNCRFQGMIPDEDTGNIGPMSKLPGCNPIWTRDMGNTKPKDCGDVTEPGWTAPNVFYSPQLSWEGWPIAAPDGMNTDFSKSKAGSGPFVQPYNTNTVHIKTANLGQVLVATDDEVKNNVLMTSATNKVDKVWGMQDSSPFTAESPSKVVPESAWNVLGYIPDTTTTLQWYEYHLGLSRPTDVPDTRNAGGPAPAPTATNNAAGSAAPTANATEGAANNTAAAGGSAAGSDSVAPTATANVSASSTTDASSTPTGLDSGKFLLAPEIPDWAKSSDSTAPVAAATGATVPAADSPAAEATTPVADPSAAPAPTAATTATGKKCRPKSKRSANHARAQRKRHGRRLSH